MMERDLYITQAASGWRIERPSGAAIERGLPSRQAAETRLLALGYKPQGQVGRAYHWVRT
jgi:hypothetical protein